MSLGWLKTVGKYAAKVGTVAAQAEGIDISQFFPKQYQPVVQKIETIAQRAHLGEIGDVITQAEIMYEAISDGTKGGSDKIKMIASPVTEILLDFLKTRGLEVENPDEVKAGSQDIASGLVRVLNACKEVKS